MDKLTFKSLRRKLNKTQRQLAQLLAVSLKAIHSYEQGWRRVPTHVERQLLFLTARRPSSKGLAQSCWDAKNCPEDRKARCPAWELDSGDLCWFINGTVCEGEIKNTWQEKITICQACPVYQAQF